MKNNTDHIAALTPSIEPKESFQVLAMSRVFSTETCMAEIPKFWSWFLENGYQKIVCGMFGMCHHAAADGKSFTYSIAAPYDGVTPVQEGFEVLTVPAHTWAIFRCVGAIPQAIQSMWPRIYSEWLPGSGYEKLKDFDIELYTMGDLESPNYESFIWISVKKTTI